MKNGDRRLWRIVDELLFREQHSRASGKSTNQRSAVLDADWPDARDEIAGDRSYSLWTRIGFWISEGFLYDYMLFRAVFELKYISYDC